MPKKQAGSTISRDVRFLGDLLGEVIQEVSGKEIFEKEEKIRQLSKQARARDEKAQSKLLREVGQLTLDECYEVALAFTTYFELINLAEENFRLEAIKARRSTKTGIKESLQRAFSDLKKHSPDAATEILKNFQLELVFTAHPTEVKRRSILSKLHRLAGLFDQAGADLPPRDLIKREIASLWMTSRSRNRKLEVRHEVDMGLWYFENSLFEVVLELQENLESEIEKNFPSAKLKPNWISFGSWIGGDRDGHPEVTAQVTENTLTTHRSRSLRRVGAYLEEWAERLSFSQYRDRFSDSLLDQLKSWSEDPSLQSILDSHSGEPYRAYLLCLRAQLTKLQRKEVLAHLDQVEKSLKESRASSVFAEALKKLRTHLDVFGLHTSRLDLRQESSVHEMAMEEVSKHLEWCAGYSSRSEEEKLVVLEDLARRDLPKDLEVQNSLTTFHSVFEPLRKLHAVEPEARGVYIISMTTSVSDILEALVLSRWAGLQIDIVPLFETAEDLREAPKILHKLFGTALYQRQLEQTKNVQTVMLGYSDSNKDCGYTTANWLIHQAQQEILDVCQAREIELVFFHGRGGSIARGGGPAARAILSQPNGMLSSKIRITEQGEVISSRYHRKGIAHRLLEQMTYGVLIGSAKARSKVEVKAEFAASMDKISKSAESQYRQLVQGTPAFIDYWNRITPIEFIKTMKIGSRPASRKPTQKVEDLRAIPWVFSWVQTRIVLPGWYGLGSGLQDEDVSLLKKMYKEWGFFRGMIDNAQLSLTRADLTIADTYQSLGGAEGKALWKIIRSEFVLTEKMILKVTGQKKILDNEKTLQDSIQLRNPYVDPLNYIQREMMERFSASQDEEERRKILQVLQLSISGISSALRSTG